MQRLATDDPSAHGTDYWIGRWYAEDGNYEKAAPYIRKELDDRFSPREFWQLRAILELSARAGEREEAASFLEDLEKKNPALLHALTGLIAEHWSGFKSLDRESQSRWLYAELQVHWDPPVPELYPAHLNSAVREFGWVLEHELKVRVFEDFQRQVAADPTLRGQLKEDYFDDTKDPFFRFLYKKPEITLGQMRVVLEDCGQSELKTHQNFSLWLRKRFSSLQEAGTIKTLKSVEEQRDRATHENVTFKVPEVLSVADATRKLLSPVVLGGRT
jgi:tetratricopeptide (TPR) repeat protein